MTIETQSSSGHTWSIEICVGAPVAQGGRNGHGALSRCPRPRGNGIAGPGSGLTGQPARPPPPRGLRRCPIRIALKPMAVVQALRVNAAIVAGPSICASLAALHRRGSSGADRREGGSRLFRDHQQRRPWPPLKNPVDGRDTLRNLPAITCGTSTTCPGCASGPPTRYTPHIPSHSFGHRSSWP